MQVDKVVVKKVLKLGNGTLVMPGTIFPNPEFPEIPREIRLELRKERGTVQVLQLSPQPAPPVVEEVMQDVSSALQAIQPVTPPPSAPVAENAPSEQIEAVVEAPEQPEQPAPKPKVKRTRKPITTK